MGLERPIEIEDLFHRTEHERMAALRNIHLHAREDQKAVHVEGVTLPGERTAMSAYT